ncbi:MAG: SPFH domain-containing protein [Lachnospiraceae bacterium]|jgi:membrane protease subunit (stomatin/prohibitin family)|nr:SPFH domain-containing protein [Lachnospiraceae bacterium]
MGLLQAAVGAAGGVLADQWLEYFYCDALPPEVLATKGKKRAGGRSSNTKGSDNIISSGSVIAVADGQCMLIVDQGKVAEVCAVPGEFRYDASTEPSIFSGVSGGDQDFGAAIRKAFAELGKRFAFGGEPPKDQRVYYINTKEIFGNKYGTPNPVPFRVVDQNIGLDIDISVRCNGEFAYRIVNPVLFYANVCANFTGDYRRETIDSQLRSELLTALQPAFAKISALGIRYSALPGHTTELAAAVNEVLNPTWQERRGIVVTVMGINSITAPKEDEDMIKELQKSAVMRNPNMAAATLVGAQADAMRAAAANAGGAMAGFMGMNMAAQAGGMNAQQLFAMGQGQQGQYVQAGPGGPGQQGQYAQGVSGAPGQQGAGGAVQPGAPTQGTAGPGQTGQYAQAGAQGTAGAEVGWTCSCGTLNKGKFCYNCGQPKPAGALLYRCDKCGWEPDDPAHPPKFCPQCGDKFDEADVRQG